MYGLFDKVDNIKAEDVDWGKVTRFKYVNKASEELNEGKKYDAGKIRFSLVPKLALIEVMRSLEYGAVKYGAQNWRKVDDLQTRYSDSAFRHMLAEAMGEDMDEESECFHLANSICGQMFKLEDLLLSQKEKSWR